MTNSPLERVMNGELAAEMAAAVEDYRRERPVARRRRHQPWCEATAAERAVEDLVSDGYDPSDAEEGAYDVARSGLDLGQYPCTCRESE